MDVHTYVRTRVNERKRSALPGLVMKVKSRAPREVLGRSFASSRFAPLTIRRDFAESEVAWLDKNKQFGTSRLQSNLRVSAGSRLISLFDFARMTSLKKGKVAHIKMYHRFYDPI